MISAKELRKIDGKTDLMDMLNIALQKAARDGKGNINYWIPNRKSTTINFVIKELKNLGYSAKFSNDHIYISW